MLRRKTPLQRKTPLRAKQRQIDLSKPPKPKRCRAKDCCGTYIPDPKQPWKNWCGDDCAVAIALEKVEKQKAAMAKAERTKDRARKEKLKTRSDWIKEAQYAFNAYIRARDRDQPCICCGKPLKDSDIGGGFDCGHYRSVGSAPHLRFDERNAHGQTKQCNRYGAGRAVDYRIGLISRIGLAAVEALETDNIPRKYSIDDLKAIKSTYQNKLRELRATAH